MSERDDLLRQETDKVLILAMWRAHHEGFAKAYEMTFGCPLKRTWGWMQHHSERSEEEFISILARDARGDSFDD